MKPMARSSAVWNWKPSQSGMNSSRVFAHSACSSCSAASGAPAAGTVPAAKRVVMLSVRLTRLPRLFASSLL